MANSDKDIRVVPNRNKSGLPNIAFTGYNNDPIVLNVLDDNTISFEGSSGQLFSVSNAVTTGTIFSVNDISGIPSFRVDADGTVGIAEFSGNVGIGLQSPQSKLSVGGDINVGAGYTFRVAGTKVLDSSSLGTGVTGSSLTSVGTISSGTWQGTAIGVNYGGTGATNASDARSFIGAATAGTNSDITRLLGVQHLFVTIPTAAAIGITVKAATSQSASMMEFVNSSNSLLAWITKDGTFAHGAYFTHNDGRVPGISVQRANAAGIVARGFNSDAFPAIEVQNNPGGLSVGLYPSGLVYGGVLQAYSSTASTNTTTGALIVAGGAAIAGTTNFGRDVRIFSSLASSSPFTGSLVVSGGVGISNNLFVGGGVAFTSSIASTSTATGTLVVTGGVGIGGSVFTSTSNASSISGVVLSNGSVTLTGTYTQSNSSTTAFQVRDGSNNPAFVIDTIGDVISLPVAVASTSTSSGSLVVAGGVGIGGTLNVNDVNVVSRLTSFASFGSTGGLSWASATVPANYTEPFNSIVYGNGKFAAIGNTAVLISTDAINWEVKNISWPVTPTSPSIYFLNAKFIIKAGNSSYIAYSDDAVTWQTTTTAVNSGTMVYNKGLYYKYSGSNVGISTNLTNWTTQTTNGYAYRILNGYFYNNAQRSIDGINFESLVFPGTAPTDINYGNGIYFGAVYNSSIYYTSTDGLNFTQSTIESNVYLGAEYYNGVYYLRCQHNIPKLYYSLDGYNYSSVNLFTNQYNLSMAFGNNKIVYIGYNPSQVNFLAYSDATSGVVDLNTKFEGSIDNVVIGRKNARSASFLDVGVSGKIVSNNTASSSTFSNNSAVFAGGVGIGQTLTVAGSVNVSNSLNLVNTTTGIATTWTRTVVGTGATISYLAYANNLYVGVGYSSLTSTDGVNWTTRTLPNDLSFVSYGNGIWSGLLYGSALGATSTNGTSWTSYAMTNNRAWTMMAFGNGKFVTLARSTNIAAYSTNGYNWTEVTMPTSQVWVWVTYGGGYFVGVANGSATAVYSTDGINWNTTTLPSAGGWGRITYGNGYYFVVGSGNLGAYSKDLINWTNYPLNVNGGNTLYSEYNNGTFVVVDASIGTNSNIITGDFSSRTAVAIPFTQSLAALVAGDRVFIAGYGQTFYTFPIPNNSITLSPNTTGEINNVEIGNTKPASGAFSNIFSQGLVAIGATARSISPYTGALVVAGGVGIGGSLFVGNTLSVASSTASTNTTSGALVVAGGVGISGNINSLGRFNFGTLSAPTMGTVSGFGTGGLTPSTTYYYKLSAIDYNNNESLPSIEYSTTLSASQYGVRFYIFPSPGAVGYKLYRTTTSGSYTNSFVQIYRVNQWINGIFYYDVGKSTSTGTPLSVTSGNTSTLGTSAESVSNVLPSLTIPTGTLQVKSPNFVGVSNNGGYAPAIETGTTDFVALRETFGFNGLSASTGGTLTPGQTYYYVATIVDHYGNESLPTPELAYTADAGGAVIIAFNVASVQIPAIRVYRTTTPGNYTNSYIGELPGNKDIGYPTMSGSPPTTTSFAGIRLNPRADFGAMSYIPNLDIAPSHRNGMLRKLDVPYTGAIAVTTSGVGGSLLPNTTYYYKCAAFDIFGNAAYPTAEVSVSTGTSTAVTISGGGGLIYAKVYRSTTKNNYSAVPTYYVNSFPFTDRGDTTFTDTPSNSSRYIQSQLFWNENNAVPQNYLRDLTVGIAGYRPFNILAPPAGINSVSASTGGTLVEGQVYYYIIEAVDIENFVSAGREPIRFTATAGGAANVSVSIVGSYGYVFYNLYRTSNLASWANSLIATGIKGSSFIDIGYPGRSGSPTFGYQRARNVMFDIAGTFHIPTIASQVLGQNLTAPGPPFRTGGNSAGSLTTNTTYYYRVVPYGGANQVAGYASDEFQYTTGANERNISWSLGGHKIGAMYYRVYRSTTFNNFTNAYYFETPHINFTDYGHSTLQTTPDIGVLLNPRNTTINLINQSYGNYLAYTTITGQSGGLKIHSKSPVITSITSGTGGTLATTTDYWYKVEAVDVYGVRTFASDEAYINTASNNSVTLTWDDVPGAYYYVVYRATASQTFANTRIASYVNARTFTDIGFSTSNVTPITIFQNGQNGATAALFQMDNAKFFGVMPRTIISNIDNTQTSWYTDFSLRITSPPVGSASGALLQVGAGFTNFSSAGFNGTTYGTQIAIGAAIGFTGSLLDAQTAGVSRFRINFDGSSNIGSTTGSGSTSTGALVISGGVGIGQSLFTSPSYSSSISGAIFSNGSATLSGTFTQNNSSTTAFQVRDGSNNPTFVIDTIADIITLPVAVASTSTGTGSLVVAGGVGIGQSINIGGRVGIGTNLLTGQINIQNPTASTPSIVIQGATSQSEDYLRIISSTGTTSFLLNSSFQFAWPNIGTLKVYGASYAAQGRLQVDGCLSVSTGPFIVNTSGGESSITSETLTLGGAISWTRYAGTTMSTGNPVRIGPLSSYSYGLWINGENGWTSGNLLRITNNGNSVFNVDYAGTTSIASTTSSTSTTTGALVVTGGVGIGGTLNISGNASIGGTLNVSGSNSYFQNNLYVGNNTQGRLYFSQATLGSAGTTVIPTMAFIGATNSPITLSVLPDNSLSFDGSSGQLFSINNNLSTGWIFSINDISGLPIFRTNADLTVAMGEYGGNVGIGLSNPTFKLQVSGNAGISGTTLISNTTTSTNTTSGALVVSGGVGIGGSLNVTSASTISGVTINSGVITGSLTGTATTATYANQSGYAITSESSNTSGYATTAGLATTATNINTVATTSNDVGFITFSPVNGGSGVALSTNNNFYVVPADGYLSASWLDAIQIDGINSNITNLTGTAVTAGDFYGPLTGNVTGTATTATNVNVVSASTSASHPVLFTPATGTASGAALSTESTFVYNPSTDILSVSGLAITSTTASTSTSTGALVVSGGVGIGGSVFTSTSNASSISGVVLSNGAITNTGTITSTGVMTLSNSSTTAFQVRDGSNNARLSVDTIGGIVSVSSSTASTNTTTGALVVSGGVGIGGTVNINGSLNSGYPSFPASRDGGSFTDGGGILDYLTRYYWVITSVDFDGNETLQSSQSTLLSTFPQYITASFDIPRVPGAKEYRVYRSTTSGVFTNSLIRITKNAGLFYDPGFPTSTGTPPTTTRASVNKISYNISNTSLTGNILHGLNIPTGSLSVNSKNDTPQTTVEISGDAAFTRLLPRLTLSASTGGTLTAGTVYYYRYSLVDIRGNESLLSDPNIISATAGGAVLINISSLQQDFQVIKIYRSTNINVWASRQIIEGTGTSFIDINYPTRSSFPLLTSSLYSDSYISGTNNRVSSLTSLVLAAGQSNFYKVNNVPVVAASASTAAGTLTTNTTYYYKAAYIDILGGTSRFGPEVAVNTGSGTAISLTVDVGQNQGAFIYRSTSPNFQFYTTKLFTTGNVIDNGSISGGFEFLSSTALNGYQWSLGFAGNLLPSNLTVAPLSNGFGLGIAARLPSITNIADGSIAGTLTTGTKYYYRIVGLDSFGQSTSSLQIVDYNAPASGSIFLQFGSSRMGFSSFDVYRSTNTNNFTDTYIGNFRNNYFTDIGFATTSGSPRLASNLAKDIYLKGVNNDDINAGFGVISNGFYTRSNVPIINTGYGVGPNSGTLTTNTNYYYKIRVHFWANNTVGEVSDPFKVNTGSNTAVYLQWTPIEGAQHYTLYRTTDHRNFTNAIIINGIKDNYVYDFNHSVATETPAPNYNGSNTAIGDTYGSRLSSLLIMGDNQKLRSLFDAPKFSTYPTSATGGTLANNTVFFYTVVARGYTGETSLASSEIRVDTGSNNAVSLNWLNVNGATGYDVYRSTTINSWTNTLIASNVQSTSFSDINYPATTGTPNRLNAYGVGYAESLFENNYNILGRSIFGSVNNVDSAYQNFTVRINGNIFRNSSASTLQVGTGFTNGYTFSGSSDGTELAIASGTGFTGSLFDAHSNGSSRFRINFDGSTTIGSSTASTSPTTGALRVTGGVGISGRLNVGPRATTYSNPSFVEVLAGFATSFNGSAAVVIENLRPGDGIFSSLILKNPGGNGIISYMHYPGFGETTLAFNNSSGGMSFYTDGGLYSFNNGPVSIDPNGQPASTSTSTGALRVTGGAGIAKTSYFGEDVKIQGTTASGSTTTGALTVSGGVGIGQTLFTSSSYASSISGVILNNGAITNTGTITSTGVMSLSNSSTTALSIKDGSNSTKFNVNTIGGVVSVSSSTASTNTLTGALVVGGGLGVSGDLFICGNANSKLNIMQSSGDEGGEIFLNKPVTNTTISNGVSIDIYQNRLRFFESGGSNRGYYIDITAGGNGVTTNLVGGGGGGSGTVTTLTAGTGISFSTGATITTTGTIRARRPMVASFCAGYTPAASGADSVVIRLPDSPSDGTTAITYEPQEFHIRVETPSATTTTIQLEKYTGTGAFSGTAITSVSISGGSTYEAQTSVFAGAGIFLTSGDKLRINFTALSASHANFSVYLELEEV